LLRQRRKEEGKETKENPAIIEVIPLRKRAGYSNHFPSPVAGNPCSSPSVLSTGPYSFAPAVFLSVATENETAGVPQPHESRNVLPLRTVCPDTGYGLTQNDLNKYYHFSIEKNNTFPLIAQNILFVFQHQKEKGTSEAFCESSKKGVAPF
jgi:hypothetical protein